MPDGSSSAAPVISPGPRLRKKAGRGPSCFFNWVGRNDCSSHYRCDLEYGPVLGGFFALDREARLCGVGSKDAFAGVFADGRTVFEAVSRASADQPNVFKIRMPVDQKISVRRVLVLADAGFG